MKAHWKKSLLLLLLMAFLCVSGNVWAVATTVYVENLQPSWTAPGGGGVWAEYWGPLDTDIEVSPGGTAIYDGREAGIIKAGYTSDGIPNWDQGLLAFQVPNVGISTFATQTLTYDVENETGTNPVWVRIRLAVSHTQYQFIPTTNPASWHTVNAAAGQWQLMDSNGNGTGPMMTLAQVAAANPGAQVDRVYLTLGMGASYYVSPGVGTVAWVDKVTIGDVTYDFVLKHLYVAKTGSDTNDCLTVDTACLTIQAAVDAADDGDPISVGPGTYVESVTVIGKSIKLIAPSGATIQCPVAPGTIQIAESGHTYRYTVAILGGTNTGGVVGGTGTITVEMSGFTIDANNFAAGDRWTSILMRNVNKAHSNGIASVHNNNLINIDPTGVESFGIQGYGTMDITIASNTITHFNRGGIGMYSGSFLINKNVVRGSADNPAQSQASNGIQVGYGASGIVSGNEVSYCGWPGTLWSGTGILVVDTSNVTVDSNYVHDCNQGNGQAIGVVDFPACLYGVGVGYDLVVSNVSVTNNKIANCDWGLAIANDVSNMTVKYNSFSGIGGDDIDVYLYDSCVTNMPRGITINFNSITGSSGDGLWVDGSMGTIDATNNWWGRDNGPSLDGTGSGSTVNALGGTYADSVNYNPWLVKPFEGYHHLMANYGSSGLWLFDDISSWHQETTSKVGAMAYYFDGTTEKVYAADSTGLWSYQLTPPFTAVHLGTAVPKNLMAFKSVLLMDYGTAYGLWQYNGTTATQLGTAAPGIMCNVGAYALIDFPGYGLFKWDGTTATLLGTAHPKNIIKFGSGVLLDYGAAYGLWKYDGTTATQLGTAAPGIMCNVGAYVLIDYPGYGLFKWDGTTITLLGTAHPENMINFGSGALLDYGTAYGLWKYDGTTATQLGTADVAKMIQVNSQVYLDYAGYGLYKYDGTTATSISKPGGVTTVADQMLDVGKN